MAICVLETFGAMLIATSIDLGQEIAYFLEIEGRIHIFGGDQAGG